MAALALIILSGCAAPATPAPTALPPLTLVAYSTKTLPPAPTPTFAATSLPIPSPTPFTYTIARGDTLSAIAERFNLSINDLLRANTGIVPQALSVGQAINIPSVSADAARPTPSPAEIELGPLSCAPSGAGTWCLVLARNPFAERVENIIAQVSLLDENGQILASQPAYALLDSIPPGASIPLGTFFPAQYANARPHADLLAATRLQANDPRYIDVLLDNTQVLIAWDGRSAQISGRVKLNQPAKRLWIVASAYSADGLPIGQRRWEWSGENSQPGKFSFPIYSLGPVIDRVEIAAEARP